MITVMGATGHTGSKIAEGLLRAGERVRALGRSVERLEPLARMGADVEVGDVADVDFLTRAFRGADSVYTLLPTDRRSPVYHQRQQQEGSAVAEAIRQSGVRHIVALSALGAELPANTGLIASLHDQEERLRAINGINVLLLRPVSFFENFSDQLEVLEQHGMIVDSIMPDLSIPMVATQDIAEAAIDALHQRDWTGVVVQELLGPRDLTHTEVARVLGAEIGKPDLAYVQVSYSEMVDFLVAAGYSASFAGLYAEMTRAFNEGRVQPRAGRTPENTTGTQFEEFVAQLASARPSR